MMVTAPSWTAGIPGLHDRAPLRPVSEKYAAAAQARIPGLHDRAPLRQHGR
ncbi:hypothetical protein HMPREF0682_2497 [Propionibacterium acidifaciens F0233]|uniref:Uncharacterized protein n=1 Tax=Propionibacterium acidifaciens F0233 TaxID=553198 RepID=U2RII4_9ACTN|nr:hypothetical protein HMPREF0682_2497 [Propionibacterium acidifaciens F0233]